MAEHVHAQAEREARSGTVSGRLALAPGDPASLAMLAPRAAGRPLDRDTQQAMSARFGFDFGQVRVHSDAAAASLAESAGARAYTIGSDVVFGAGRYAPDSPAGQALLAHELSHVVQQSTAGVRTVQRDDKTAPVPAPTTDPETVFGTRLARDFPNGVALAFYAPMPSEKDKEAAMWAAKAWATREQALGIDGKTVTLATAKFGVAMNEDEHPLVATIQAIGRLLTSAVGKAPPNPAGPLPPGQGPATVRTLAIFAHGTSTWCGLGAITSGAAAGIIRSVAPQLASNVNVVLFSCNSGRSPDESEEWVRNSMTPGGGKSLGSVTRDALLAEGKSGGTVWGHGVSGHVTDVFALREFDVTDGAGAEGASYVRRYVYSGGDQTVVSTELVQGMLGRGYVPATADEARIRAAADAQAFQEMYNGYASANAKLKYQGGSLAASIPTHPVEIGAQIKTYWDTTYWPGRRAEAIDKFVKDLGARGWIKKQSINAVP